MAWMPFITGTSKSINATVGAVGRGQPRVASSPSRGSPTTPIRRRCSGSLPALSDNRLTITDEDPNHLLVLRPALLIERWFLARPGC